MSLCLTTSNLVFLFQAQIFLFTLLLITGVGVATYNAVNRVLTYVVDSPSCSIFLVGYIAELVKNWYDTTSTFLVSTKEGLKPLTGPEIAYPGRHSQELPILVKPQAPTVIQNLYSSWSAT